MVEGGGCTAFPLLFFDGNREEDIGDVEISPTLEYKPFQQMLSKMIGISPNQISIYLVNRNRTHAPEDRRRIPITGKVNFTVVCRQKRCSFLAVLKRSRKSRNRRDRMMMMATMMMSNGAAVENDFSPDPAPDNRILLRRNPEVDDLNVRLRLRDLNGRLQSLRIQEEKFQASTGNANFPSVYGSDSGEDLKFFSDSFPSIEDIYRVNSTGMIMTAAENEAVKGVFCEECLNAKNGDGTAAFHHCVNDAVITCFNNRLPPINRPGNISSMFAFSK